MENKRYFIPNYITEKYTKHGYIITNNLNEARLLLDNVEFEQYKLIKMKGTDKIISELEKVLKEEDILIDACFQKEMADILNITINETLYITLMPTEACNFKCIYCYEDHIAETMNEETIQGIENFVGE